MAPVSVPDPVSEMNGGDSYTYNVSTANLMLFNNTLNNYNSVRIDWIKLPPSSSVELLSPNISALNALGKRVSEDER